MKLFAKFFLLLIFTPTLASAQAGLDTLSLKSIFYEPLLAGNRPNMVSFSPDLSHVYYQGNDSAMVKNKLYQVSVDGQDTKPAPDNIERRFSVSPDGKKLVYSKEGDIWIADLNFENEKRLIETKSREYNPVWAPNSEKIAFGQDGDVWVLHLGDAKLVQVTSKKEQEPNFSIADWAGNNRIIVRQTDRSDYREYYFPEYVGQYVKPGTTRRGVGRQLISVAYIDSGVVKKLHEQKGYVRTDVSSSGQYLAIDAMDADMKERSITIHDIVKNDSLTVFDETTEGWFYNTNMEFAPSGNKLMFQSEKEGWNHIYTVNPDGSGLRQHTEGEFDIPWATWLNHEQVVFASNEVDPGERHLYTLNIRKNKITRLTTQEGYRKNFELSRDGQRIVYEYTYFNEPTELYALNLKNPSEENRLTYSIPDRFKDIEWQQEDYIRFTARDGETELSMSILEPHDMQENKSYPVVVFVHGAGSLQNVYKGWSQNYYREYMFHQYLNARGYYVIEVDYRHSTGYGRKFREDVTNWMGKYETRDIVDGIEYLAEHYPKADTSNVGIYGGSYGGFMSLYATSVEPDYFDAAAALRAVTNWENYYYTNPWYTRPRLGIPETDSTHYARSSPITYAEELEQPVLILHGLIDNNVGFQDAAQYIEKLIQTGGKEFEMMMYPSERHSFQDPDAWFDEYTRIFEFFNEHLKSSDS